MPYWKSFSIQATIVCVVLLVLGYAIHNLMVNTYQLGITVGFDFLWQTAGFPISEQWLNFTPKDSNAMVWLVGVVNLVVVSLCSCITASALGFVIALASMTGNRFIVFTARGYIEIFRNIPLLLQILFWYNLWINKLPQVRSSWHLAYAWVNNRGVFLPVFPVHAEVLLGMLLVVLLAKYFHKEVSRIHGFTLVLATVGLWWLGSALWAWKMKAFAFPTILGFKIENAWHIHPEFIGLWLGLSIYTGAFCAEIFRSGLQAIPSGQIEASASLGLSTWQRYTNILLPQSLPTVIPPLTSQYVNVQKNASLGVVVGYPEVFAVFAGTVLNQSGRAVEIMGITMLTYGVLSFIIFWLFSRYNQRFTVWTSTSQG